MRKYIQIGVFLSSLLLTTFSYSQSGFSVGFYNVENLFDTVDEPVKFDDDFTPEGRQKWTNERYEAKLDKIGQVIAGMGMPAIMGLCEVENAKVVGDLVQSERIKEKDYSFVHFESPDMRGIDVALMYRYDLFTVDTIAQIRVEFPKWLEPEGYTSRDILYARLLDADQNVWHVFVNHWPSRRGGTAESEHRRLWVAEHLRYAVNDILNKDNDARIFIMGDFNDEPQNHSVSNVLGALPLVDMPLLPGLLYNPFSDLQDAEQGSYNYRGDWNMLDQILFTGITEQSDWTLGGFGIFKEDWLLFKGEDGTADPRPSRTYGGPNYYGGYSDHLPVFMEIVER